MFNFHCSVDLLLNEKKEIIELFLANLKRETGMFFILLCLKFAPFLINLTYFILITSFSLLIYSPLIVLAHCYY